jgi:3,5-epimerase/4-reductase
MKLLVYGSKGWIGQQFIKILINKNIEFTEGLSRTDNENTLLDELEKIKPSHIISFIGRTHGTYDGQKIGTIDYLEKKGKLVENVRDNLFSPFLLAHYCYLLNIHYTYLGTGCIFTYDEKHPFGVEKDGFTEESLPNFFGSSYSIVKGFTDRIMKLYKNVLTLRIRMPITETLNDRNFISKIVNYEKICSIPNSMTVLPELLPYALDMLINNKTGIYNFTNPGLISHNEILEMYKEIVEPNFTWNNFSIEEQNKVIASERSNNFLETEQLTSLYPVKNIKVSVRECLIKYKHFLDT